MRGFFISCSHPSPNTAMKNEALCKFLCHNIVVLMHAIHRLGILPSFASAANQTALQTDPELLY